MREATAKDVLGRGRFLLDTNIIGHLIHAKRAVEPGIIDFFETVDEDRMYLSAITIGEIGKGIDLIPWPKSDAGDEYVKRCQLQAQLEQRLEDLCARFDGRIITIDIGVARQWGRFHSERQRVGRKTPVVDTMIAACAQQRALVLVSTDADFSAFGDVLTIYDPRTKTVYGHTQWTVEP